MRLSAAIPVLPLAPDKELSRQFRQRVLAHDAGRVPLGDSEPRLQRIDALVAALWRRRGRRRRLWCSFRRLRRRLGARWAGSRGSRRACRQENQGQAGQVTTHRAEIISRKRGPAPRRPPDRSHSRSQARRRSRADGSARLLHDEVEAHAGKGLSHAERLVARGADAVARTRPNLPRGGASQGKRRS